MKYKIFYYYDLFNNNIGVREFKNFKEIKKSLLGENFKLWIEYEPDKNESLIETRPLFFQIKNGLLIYGSFWDKENKLDIFKYDYNNYIVNLYMYKEFKSLINFLSGFTSQNLEFKQLSKIYMFNDNNYIMFIDKIGKIHNCKILKFNEDKSVLVNYNNKKQNIYL